MLGNAGRHSVKPLAAFKLSYANNAEPLEDWLAYWSSEMLFFSVFFSFFFHSLFHFHSLSFIPISKKEKIEKSDSGSEETSSEIQHAPLNRRYRIHKCSSACLSNRAVSSYRGENPLKIPILFHFQRRHAKADCLSKSLDVHYKAPCGRSLRSFQDVQNYLFETKCDFLFIDHFSFNTYVLLGRNIVNPEPLVFDLDISNGAESVPISFSNDIDRARLPYFKYRRASWPRGYYLNNLSSMFLDSCDCTDGCIDR